MQEEGSKKNAVCPKCNKTLNDYELNKLWCTNCNARFKSIEDLYNSNPKLKNSNEATKKLLNDFLITTGRKFEGYRIIKYFNLLDSEVVMGTGALSEINAKISDIFGDTFNKFEQKIQEAKEMATTKIVNSALGSGSNAIIGFRYNIFSLSNNIIAVSAYGTAVEIIK